jgi:hypothetical protein
MQTLSGGCHCGNIRVELELTRAAETYNPRACDCDFCRKHGASYFSDPKGSLAIRIQDAQQLSRYRQGAGLADMLVCKTCGVMTGVIFQADGRTFAAVNSKIIEGQVRFGAEQPVSPKLLSGSDKAQRWQDIWFSQVRIDERLQP